MVDQRELFLTVFKIFNISCIFIGISNYLLNGSILLFMVRKPKKTASEVLIVATLSIDLLYGVCLVYLGIVQSVEPGNSNLVFFHHICYYSLILTSLMMQIFIAVNRYFAVVKPFQYRMMFNKSKVILYILVIIAIGVSYGLAFVVYMIKVE